MKALILSLAVLAAVPLSGGLAAEGRSSSSSSTFASRTGARPLEATFARESYGPGARALLRVSAAASSLTIQLEPALSGSRPAATTR